MMEDILTRTSIALLPAAAIGWAGAFVQMATGADPLFTTAMSIITLCAAILVPAVQSDEMSVMLTAAHIVMAFTTIIGRLLIRLFEAQEAFTTALRGI